VTSWLVRWRLALRIARRDALRHRGRTLLVLAMVGLPVMAVVGIDTLYRTNEVTPVEALPATLGASDARISGESREQVWADPSTGATVTPSPAADPPWTAADVAALLPPGSALLPTVEGKVSYRTDAGYAEVAGLAEDLSDPALDGALTLLDGRFPRADDEIAVSRQIAARGVDVGDELTLTRDDVPVTVVGVVRSPSGSSDPFLVVPPSGATLLDASRTTYLATVPGGLNWPAVRALNQKGLVVVSREVVADPPPEREWMPGEFVEGSSTNAQAFAVLALIVASVVLQIVLLAGPAFAVGVRRQRRDLALIAATGGSPRDLRRVVLASGVVLGAGAAVLGAVAGLGAARLAVPLMEHWSSVSFGPYEVPVRDLLITVAVGAVAGLAAAEVPARQAARTDVVNALAGRRGQVRTSWRSPVLGLALAGAGAVLTVMGAQGTELGVAGGAVLLVVGMVVAAPWLVGLLAPVGSRLPTAGRLALRDATRNRSRTAPAVAAVMATVAGVTALAIGSQSDSTQGRRDYIAQAPMGTVVVRGDVDADGWTDMAQLMRRQMPDRDVHELRGVAYSTPGQPQRDMAVTTVGCTDGLVECRWYPDAAGSVVTMQGDLVVADSATARALDTLGLPDEAFRALDAGRVAVLGRGAVDHAGQVTLVAAEYDDAGNGTEIDRVSLPAVEVDADLDGDASVFVPATVIVPPALADRLPLPTVPQGLVAGSEDDPVTPAEERTLQESISALSSATSVYVERGWTDPLAVARWLLFALGGLLVLVATLTATGLALTEARPDFATLAAVGAAPRLRRYVAMGSAAVIGGVGSVLGLVVGVGPGIAVAYPLTSTDYGNGAHPLVDVPWLLLAGVGVLVPLLAVAVTGFAVRSRLPMERRIA
jgi:putative ABC transport system permease protein